MLPDATDDIVSGLAETGIAVTTNKSNAVSTAIAPTLPRSLILDQPFIPLPAEISCWTPPNNTATWQSSQRQPWTRSSLEHNIIPESVQYKLCLPFLALRQEVQKLGGKVNIITVWGRDKSRRRNANRAEPGISRVYFGNNDRKRRAQDDPIIGGQDSG